MSLYFFIIYRAFFFFFLQIKTVTPDTTFEFFLHSTEIHIGAINYHSWKQNQVTWNFNCIGLIQMLHKIRYLKLILEIKWRFWIVILSAFRSHSYEKYNYNFALLFLITKLKLDVKIKNIASLFLQQKTYTAPEFFFQYGTNFTVHFLSYINFHHRIYVLFKFCLFFNAKKTHHINSPGTKRILLTCEVDLH